MTYENLKTATGKIILNGKGVLWYIFLKLLLNSAVYPILKQLQFRKPSLQKKSNDVKSRDCYLSVEMSWSSVMLEYVIHIVYIRIRFDDFVISGSTVVFSIFKYISPVKICSGIEVFNRVSQYSCLNVIFYWILSMRLPENERVAVDDTFSTSIVSTQYKYTPHKHSRRRK